MVVVRRGHFCGNCLPNPNFFPEGANKLADFYIRAGDNFNPTAFDPTTFQLCHYQPTALGIGETRTFNWPSGVAGRYVSVNFPVTRTESIHMCEVEVYGKITLYSFGIWLNEINVTSFTQANQQLQYMSFPEAPSAPFYSSILLCHFSFSCEHLLLQPWSVEMTPTLL